MSESYYNKDTIDEKFKGVHDRFDNQDKTLNLILSQTTKHNGRLTKVERILLVVGTAVIVLLIASGSKFVDFAMAVVK